MAINATYGNDTNKFSYTAERGDYITLHCLMMKMSAPPTETACAPACAKAVRQETHGTKLTCRIALPIKAFPHSKLGDESAIAIHYNARSAQFAALIIHS